MAAAAVGLGNLWRFPYMVGENGGGAFILAYLCMLVVVALPIMMLEVGAGHLAHGSVVRTFGRLRHWGRPYGWFIVLLTVLITSYYLVITGWTLGYSVAAVGFSLEPFDRFTSGFKSVWYFLAVIFLAMLVLIRGVTAIETVSKFLLPMLAAMVCGVAIFAQTLDGQAEAWSFMFDVRWAELSRPGLWVLALGQAFYSLTIGQGYLITYGSYIPPTARVPRASLVVAGSQVTISLLAALMIFPFVFTFGHDPASGSHLAFTVLPGVFADLAGGSWLAIAFFFMFFAAAFSSCLAGLKVVISALSDELGLTDRHAVFLTCGLLALLGLPSALSYSPVSLSVGGVPFLQFVDQVGGTNVVIASGAIGTALFCWFVPRARLASWLGLRDPRLARVMVALGRGLPLFIALLLTARTLMAGG